MEEKDMLEILFRGFGKRKQKQPKIASVTIPQYVELDGKKVDIEVLAQTYLEKENKKRVQQGLPPYESYIEWKTGEKDHFEKNQPRDLTEEDKVNLCRRAGFEYSPKKDLATNKER